MKGTQIFIVGFMVFILVGSIMGFIFGRSDMGFRYNGINFYEKDQWWGFKINKNEYIFLHRPDEVEHIKIDDQIYEDFKTSPMFYFGFDPEIDPDIVDLIRYDVYKVSNNQGLYFEEGVTEKSENYDMEVLDCQNRDNLPVILIKVGEESKIDIQDKCVTLTVYGNQDGVLYFERFLYGLLGVIKNE